MLVTKMFPNYDGTTMEIKLQQVDIISVSTLVEYKKNSIKIDNKTLLWGLESYFNFEPSERGEVTEANYRSGFATILSYVARFLRDILIIVW